MELQLIAYSFGTAILLLFVYINVLALFFVKHIRSEIREEESF